MSKNGTLCDASSGLNVHLCVCTNVSILSWLEVVHFKCSISWVWRHIECFWSGRDVRAFSSRPWRQICVWASAKLLLLLLAKSESQVSWGRLAFKSRRLPKNSAKAQASLCNLMAALDTSTVFNFSYGAQLSLSNFRLPLTFPSGVLAASVYPIL